MKILCYNVITKEREEHSDVRIKYRTYISKNKVR